MKRLLKVGANPNHVFVSINIVNVSNYYFLLQYGQSVLHIAIESGSNDIISILLSTNIDLSILDVSKINICTLLNLVCSEYSCLLYGHTLKAK